MSEDPLVGVDVDTFSYNRTAVYVTLPREEALAIARRWIAAIENDERPYFRDYMVFLKDQVRDPSGRPFPYLAHATP